MRTIDGLFRTAVERDPEKVAVAFDGLEISYGELARRSRRLAHALRSLGVGREVPVAVVIERSIDFVVAVLGILQAGGAYVPIDPTYPGERRRFVLEDTSPPVVLTRALLAELLEGGGPETPLDDSARTPSDLATILYTSGSTGRPKGVSLEHRGVVELLAEPNFLELTREDVVAGAANVAFDASMVEMFGALINGARLELLRGEVLLSPDTLADVLRERRISFCFLTTGLLNQVGRLRPDAFRTLKTLHFGGDVADPRSVRAILEACGPLRVINGYGPTEGAMCALAHQVTQVGEGSIPIGRPVGGTEVYLIDGEIHLGGPRIARGYWNRPELTAEKFIENPLKPGTRIYKTGDLARLRPDGEYEFLGRADFQVKIRGFRVELGEIEAALAGHPGISESTVLAIAGGGGGGEKRLVAHVVGSEGADLREYLAARLPAFMVPQEYHFHEKLPLTAFGKIDRLALASHQPTAAAAAGAAAAAAAPALAPRTETERRVAALISEILSVPAAGRDQTFFELGGHSLSVMQLSSRIRESFAREVPARLIFEHATIEQIAAEIDRAPAAESEEPPPRTAEPALTFSQGRVWFIESLEPGNIAYNSTAILRFKGALDATLIERAITQIIRRHESLRTTVEPGPKARIHAPWKLELPPVDRPGLFAADRAEEARRLARADAERAFDPSKLPLIRWTLVRFAPDDHALLQVEHHLVHDGWSFNVFLHELTALYRAYSEGRPSPLPELPMQLADFARRQQLWMETEAAKAQLEYWKSRLDRLPVLELPTHPRPQQQTFRGRAPRMTINAQTIAALRALAQSESATLFVTMLAAFQALLQRYADQDEIVLGTGIANRRTRESESLIGMLINNVVLRTELGGDPTVSALIERTKQTMLGAFENQDVPFERVVEIVRPVRDPSRNPLMQVMFSFHDAPLSKVELPGLEITTDLAIENGTAKLDLNVIGMPHEDGAMTVLFEHNSELFDADLIARMMRAYASLLEQLPAARGAPISTLQVLSPEEERTLREVWNQTAVPYPRDRTVHELFAQVVARRPDATALLFGESRMTYRELHERSRRIAARLFAMGVRPGGRVAFFAARTPDMVATMLGILQTGAAYVPLDPAYPAERLLLMLRVTSPSVACVESALPPHLGDPGVPVLKLDRDVGPPGDGVPAPAIGAEASAYIMFTSGSTGEPRGVDVPHRAIVRLLFGASYVELGEEETLLHLSPISFDASTFELWGALLHGGRCVLFPEGTPSPRALAALIQKHQVTTLWLTSSLFNAVIDDGPELAKSLKQLITGGEALSVAHVERALKKLPGVQLINGYGPTESTTFACCYKIPPDFSDRGSVPIGKPISNTTAYVFDRKNRLAPIGVPGELHLGGDGLARGYFGRPELTAEKFITLGERLYKTGDRVRFRSDGNLEFLGRFDHQVKVRGFRVELGEIEAVIARHPGVKASAAVVAVDPRGEKRIAAFVVPEAGVTLGEGTIAAHLRTSLPEHMLPSSIEVLPALPLTPIGKVDRQALAQRAPAVRQARYEAPMDPSEVILAGIWERLLGKKQIGRHDNFFELGGHSLLAARLVDEMERELGVRLPLTAVFNEATIAVMARKLNDRGENPPLVTAVQPLGHQPPFFFLHGDFNGGGFYTTRIARVLGTDQPFYILHPFGVHGGEVPRTVDLMAEQYLDEIRKVRRHGPYRIGGYCTGGLVAYEVARRLAEAGELIDRLVLVDAHPRNTRLAPILSKLRAIDERASSALEQGLRRPLIAAALASKQLRESRGRPLRETFGRWEEKLRRFQKVKLDSETRAPAVGAEDRSWDMIGLYRRILAAHVPREYSGPLTVLWPRDDPEAERSEPTGGWKQLARDVEVRTVPGSHLTCVTTHWEALAAELRECLVR